MIKYFLIVVFGSLSAVNMLIAYRQKPSTARTVSLWFNGVALVLIATATIISLMIHES